MKKTNQKGFTLIELLVVIAIIGLLSTLAVVALNNARSKARDAKRVADVKQMQTALEMYYNECNGYPTHDAAAGNLHHNAATGNFEQLESTSLYNNGTADCGTAFGKFLSQIPTPPSPTDNTTVCSAGGLFGGDGNSYEYASCDDAGDCDATVAGRGASYMIEYCLGAQTGGLVSGLHYATPAGM